MKLFNDVIDHSLNLLPKDGTVNYFGTIFSKETADAIFKYLYDNITWKHDQGIMFGKPYTTKRKVAWYGEKAFEYKYSGISRKALPFQSELLRLKKRVEEITKESFNTCLCNLYHNGSENMGWHTDDEKELKKHAAIASLSFGAQRNFDFKHKKTNQKIRLLLEHGSLLVMKGETQNHWLHCLPASKVITEPRINLTFRTIVNIKE